MALVVQGALPTDKPSQCIGCPLIKTCHGFIPGIVRGQPMWRLNASNGHMAEQEPITDWPRICLVGEAPATDELLQGVPFAGRAGNVLKNWILANVGIDFNDCIVDNVIRCALPENKKPEAFVLRQAMLHCSVYDRYLEFKPTHDILTYHPSSLFHDTVPLPLILDDIGRKAREMIDLNPNARVRVLLGDTAIRKYYPYASAVSRWRGHVIEMPEIRMPDWATQTIAKATRKKAG